MKKVVFLAAVLSVSLATSAANASWFSKDTSPAPAAAPSAPAVTPPAAAVAKDAALKPAIAPQPPKEATPPAAPAIPSVSIHGSSLFISILEAHKAEVEKDSGATINLVANGPDAALLDVEQGRADVAVIAGKIEDAATRINAKKKDAVEVSALKTADAGKAHVAFVVNASNTVKTLTQAQVTDILSGKTTNWKQVGGPERGILVIVGTPADEVRQAVEKGKPIEALRREVIDSTMISSVVGQMPEAFGIVNAAYADDSSVHEVKVDNVADAKFTFVTKGKPSAAVQKVIDASDRLAK